MYAVWEGEVSKYHSQVSDLEAGSIEIERSL